MMNAKQSFLFFSLCGILLIFLPGCGVSKYRDLTYLPADTITKKAEMKLDIFSPKNATEKKDVFIFIHGGGWSHGKKSQYAFLGKRMARKGIIGVNINYPLYPDADYNDMAIASAKAVKWVKENIDKYGGNPDRIFVSGHSAGGQMAALISVKEEYFKNLGIKDPLKGVILIDAAGLDMYTYLKTQAAIGDTHYQPPFSSNPENWKKASPIYFINKEIPPMLIYTGGKTYPNISESNQRFVAELKKYQPELSYSVVKHKHHIPMIFQFYNAHNYLYKEIISFMKAQK